MQSITLEKYNLAKLQDFITLCKPRVVLLMLITAWVGMQLASTAADPISLYLCATLGIALVGSSAAILNHIVDKNIDQKMQRTSLRPIASQRISQREALIFASCLGTIGITVLFFYVNPLSALLNFLTLVGYAGIYTLYLKRATPQNIVIGGLAGAMPPLLGWAAISNTISPYALLLVGIIFVWTPPHFWALAIYRQNDYKKANIPMLPVTHGVKFTKLNILLYTLLLSIVTLMPYIVGMSSGFYLIASILLNIGFLYYAIKLYCTDVLYIAMQTFHYSILYLLLLFIAILFDHYLFRNY